MSIAYWTSFFKKQVKEAADEAIEGCYPRCDALDGCNGGWMRWRRFRGFVNHYRKGDLNNREANDDNCPTYDHKTADHNNDSSPS